MKILFIIISVILVIVLGLILLTKWFNKETGVITYRKQINKHFDDINDLIKRIKRNDGLVTDPALMVELTITLKHSLELQRSYESKVQTDNLSPAQRDMVLKDIAKLNSLNQLLQSHINSKSQLEKLLNID